MAHRKDTNAKGKLFKDDYKPEITRNRPLTRLSTPREVSLILKDALKSSEKVTTSRKGSDLARASTQCSLRPTHGKTVSALHSPTAGVQTVSARLQVLERANETLTAQLYAERKKNFELESVIKYCLEKLQGVKTALGLEQSSAQETKKSVSLRIKPVDKAPSRAVSADTSFHESVPEPSSVPLLQLVDSLSRNLGTHQSQLSSLFLSIHHLTSFTSRLSLLIQATKTGSLGHLLRSDQLHSHSGPTAQSISESQSKVEQARREMGEIEAQLIDWFAEYTANKCTIA